MTAESKHDIAYGCFLVPAAACLIATLTSTEIGTVAFFVLILLMMVSLAVIPLGVFYSTVFWRDGVLPLLSILTISMAGVFVTTFYDQLTHGSPTDDSIPYRILIVLAILVLVLEASWFLWRRRTSRV